MKLPKSFTTVTTLSKVLAMLLFVFLPFIGFCLGIKYLELQASVRPEEKLLPESVPVRTIAPKETNSSPVTNTDCSRIECVFTNDQNANIYDQLVGYGTIEGYKTTYTATGYDTTEECIGFVVTNGSENLLAYLKKMSQNDNPNVFMRNNQLIVAYISGYTKAPIQQAINLSTIQKPITMGVIKGTPEDHGKGLCDGILVPIWADNHIN